MKYVALLRGINVGGNNKVNMRVLKTVFESLGFTNVSTYINSGNVIFETNKTEFEKLVNDIELAIATKFGFPVRVIVRDAANIEKVCKAIPPEWTNDTHMKTDVLFLWDHYDSHTTLKLIHTNPDVDNLIYVSGAIIWNLDRAHYNSSSMHKFIGTDVYKHMTARNVNTVRKLASLLQAY